MGVRFRRVCFACGEVLSRENPWGRCPRCGSYGVPRFDPALPLKDFRFRRMWRYWPRLPLEGADPVTLGEGDTPLVPLREDSGPGRLWVKWEGLNPTGTYKDRPASVTVSRARETGAGGVIVASDGNNGPAVAAYAARAGLPCLVLMPRDTPAFRCRQAAAYGARIVLVEGDINDCLEVSEAWGRELGYPDGSTAIHLNPYHEEADKTIAYEIFEELGRVPDWVSVPLGGGGVCAGVCRGFRDLADLGLTDRVPRPVAAQAAACAPFVRAVREGRPLRREPCPGRTLALTIAVPFPADGEIARQALEASGGEAVAVEEAELAAATLLLARQGMLVEPTGAVSLAALLRCRREGLVREGDVAVAVATGTGLKVLGEWEDLENLDRSILRIPRGAGVPEALREEAARRMPPRGGGSPEERGVRS